MDGYEITIKPKNQSIFLNLGELWRYRDLFYIFTWRDIKVKYKQTVLGIIWVVFQPLVTTIIFTIFFNRVAKIPSDNLPYPLFVLTGLVFWNFFATSLTQASTSMTDNENIIKKVYFPRLILPLSTIITGLVDFLINLIVLMVFTLISGFRPSAMIFIILPIVLIITMMTSAGLGMFLSSVNVKYRDVRYILPFFIQILLFVSPIIYPASLLSSISRPLLFLNPMTGVVETMRVVIGGSSNIPWVYLLISIFSAALIFLFGIYYFRRTEQFFADIV